MTKEEHVSKEKSKEEHFSKGTLVEVSSDEDGFQGAWFAATVVEQLSDGKFMVEYQSLRNEDDTELLREEVDSLHIRPYPPNTLVVDRFNQLEEVDALYNDGWWVGMVSKVLNKKYMVYFRGTNEEMEFKHSDLRLHQEWIDGKWVLASGVCMTYLYLCWVAFGRHKNGMVAFFSFKSCLDILVFGYVCLSQKIRCLHISHLSCV